MLIDLRLAKWLRGNHPDHRNRGVFPARRRVRARLAAVRLARPALALTTSLERYARGVKTFNLRSAKLRSGEEFGDEIELELGALEYGGQRYLPVPDTVPAELAISRRTVM